MSSSVLGVICAECLTLQYTEFTILLMGTDWFLSSAPFSRGLETGMEMLGGSILDNPLLPEICET